MILSLKFVVSKDDNISLIQVKLVHEQCAVILKGPI